MHGLRLALAAALSVSLLAGDGRAEPPRSERRAAAEARFTPAARFPPRAATAARFQGWTPLSDYVAAGLTEGGSFRVTLPTRAGEVEVALHPSVVHAAGYSGEERAADGVRRGRGRPRVHTFAGAVARGGSAAAPERGGSAAALERGSSAAAPGRGGDFARLAREPGGRVSGVLRVDGVLYDLASDPAAGDLLLHVREVTADELAGLLDACGAELGVAAAEAAGDEGAAVAEAAGALREIELGTEADALFVAQTGGVAAANAKILSIVNAINGIYETDLGLTNRVVFQRAWNGSDPYTSNDSGALLSQFRSAFLSDVAAPTDDAQLFSGRDFEGNTVGRAFLDSTCGSYRFGVNQYYQQSDSLTRLIVAHEMGHNLGSGHTASGIMAPSIDPGVVSFDAASRSEIAGYVGSVSCLGAVSASGPPVLSPIGPQHVTEGETLALQLQASDPDGDALVWSAVPLPPGATLSSSGAFRWRPALDTVGCGGFLDRNVTFGVSDTDGNRATESVVISALDAPGGAPPVLADPADRSIGVGQALTLPLAASDADGDRVSYSGAGLPSGAALSTSGVFSWTPAAAQLGTHAMSFTATDCTGRSASQSLSLEVVASPPVLAALSAPSGAKGDFVTITGQNLAGRKLKVWFGPKKAKAREVTATSLRVKVPKKPKRVTTDTVAVTVVRDGIASTNALSFRWLARPAP